MEWRLLLTFALAAMLVFGAESASKTCDDAEGCCDFELELGSKIYTPPAANDEAPPQNQPPESNEGNRRVLITGANQGLGLATSMALASLGGYDLTMTCRSERKCHETLTKVGDVAKAGIKLMCETVDFASIETVKSLAAKFAKRTTHHDVDYFDVAILNAGVWLPDELTTKDKLETSFQVNYLAQYLLLKTVIDIRRHGRPPYPLLSVIPMTSIAHHFAWINGRHVTSDPHEWGCVDPAVTRKTCNQALAYARSKWAMAALTVQLNKEYSSKMLHAVAVDPGYMNTSMTRTGPDASCIHKFMEDCFAHAPELAAENVVYTVQNIDKFRTNQYRYVNAEGQGSTRTLTGSVVEQRSLDKLHELTNKLLGPRY